jgi:hypothetical protein
MQTTQHTYRTVSIILFKSDPTLPWQRIYTSLISKKVMEQIPHEATIVDSEPKMFGPDTLC